MQRRAWIVLVLCAACTRDDRHRARKLDPSAPAAVVFATRPEARVVVELADTTATIRRGLMQRTDLGPDDGMLFFMGRDHDHAFWMRDTLIPLDMIFIARDLRVAGIVANAAPRSERLRRAGTPSRYVLEVNAGWAAAHQVAPGTAVRFENLDPHDP